ncbi:two component regulator propeller family protein, partial [Vibrio parahaemolyticus V-223/04]
RRIKLRLLGRWQKS